ncbi:hypothetical protein O181_039495 [Austropuccinia psidii MF-1]|uniref:CCHC-type domain-containing protein n=1 Tax=Austropuccinia psidii MF-1 TaxID=1389203 RepID=A0A9Q3HF82_9BASI|nr:hypothetical protein [Austropuccinia psidii MF-1]
MLWMYDIKPDSMLMNKARAPSKCQDGDNMSYSEKEALKELPESSSWRKPSGTGEYDHMELIDYIDGLFIDVQSYQTTGLLKRTNIWKYTPYKSSGFKEKQPFRVNFKEKHRERVAEVAKKKNSCHNCGSTDHYANNCPKAKKRVYAIEKVPEEESLTEDSEADSMGDAIREHSDDDQEPREELLVKYQEQTPLKIQDIQLEAGMPQDTANKNLCKQTQDAQTFLVTPTKGMWRTALHSGKKVSGQPLSKLGNQLFPTKAKNLKSESGKITSIGTIIKELIIPHKKGNIRVNPEFVVLDYAHIQGFFLGTDYQKIEGQFSTTLTSKQKLSLLRVLRQNRPAFAIGEEPLGKIRGHDIELYLDVERPYPPILRRPPYPASLQTTKGIEKHINELLDMNVIRKVGRNEIVEITTPVLITWHDGKSRLCGGFRALNYYTKADRYPIPRIPHPLDKLAKAIYITKMNCMKAVHQNRVKPSSMKLLRIICYMVIYEYTRIPFVIKNEPAHFQRMMNTIFQEEILEVWMVVYIDDVIIYSETWEDNLQYIDRVLSKCTPINLKISLQKGNFGQQELLALGHKVSGLSMAIDQNKVAAGLQKPVPRNIKEIQYFLGFASYYRNQIKHFAHIASSLYKLCSKDKVFGITKEKRDAYERIKYELTNAPVRIFPDFELPFKLYIDAACSQGLGAALHKRHILDGELREGVICYISRKLKDSEARYGDTQTEFLFLVWALENIHYYLVGAVFEVYTDCTALKYLLNMKTTNRHILRWRIAIQEYRGNMTIIYKEGKIHTNADGLSRWPLDNAKSNTAYDPEVEAKIPIHFMEIDRKRNFRFSEWSPESGTPDSGNTD